MNARHFLLAIAVASIAIAACNGGLPTPVGSQAAVPVNSDPGIGLFLGVAPSAPLSNYVVTGAAIPNSVGGHHRVMLLAFTTAASAADSDGDDQTTDPLDLSRDPMSGMPTTPTDDNGAQDVFLSALVSNAEDMSGAFNLRIFDVTQNARCIKCHGQNYPGPCLPGNSHPTHAGGSQCDTNSCTECHMEILPGVPLDPDGMAWRSPPFCDQQQNPQCTIFDFRNRGADDLCRSIANRFGGVTADIEELKADIEDHLTQDPFIRWAITDGTVPTTPESIVPTVPIDFDTEWRAAVHQWVQGFDPGSNDPSVRFNCLSLGSRRDIVAVSRAQAGGATGNASSRRPSITYVPNPAFQAPGMAPVLAGTAYIAYDSDATNLVAGDTNGAADVFRSTVEVWVDAAFYQGNPTDGSVDLRYVAGENRRVSVRDLTSAQGSGRATNASIGASGDRIAFESEDTNIADPNGDSVFDDDSNGFTDVYVREVTAARTQLVSIDATGLAPGNGDSTGPVMSLGSDRGIVFESLATDLVPGDTNGQRDVFYALMGPSSIVGVGPVARASLADGGGQATGGDSARPSLYVLDADADDVLVGFESTATNLVAAVPPNSTLQAYLYESATRRTTLLNQKRLPLLTMGSAQGGAAPADSMGVRISPDGRYVFFESLADNIDFVRPVDDNGASDVFRVELAALLGSGRVRPERISITRDGDPADAASTAVLVGGFRRPGVSDAGGPVFDGTPVLFQSLASNLPSDDSNGAILVFAP